MTYKFNENFTSAREVRRSVWFAQKQFPNCRAGQAFCNVYLKARESWPEVYYEENQDTVISKIIKHCLENSIEWVG